MENYEIVHWRNLFCEDVKAFFSSTSWFWLREEGGKLYIVLDSAVQEQ